MYIHIYIHIYVYITYLPFHGSNPLDYGTHEVVREKHVHSQVNHSFPWQKTAIYTWYPPFFRHNQIGYS